jgi:hypothetical protein
MVSLQREAKFFVGLTQDVGALGGVHDDRFAAQVQARGRTKERALPDRREAEAAPAVHAYERLFGTPALDGD